MKSFITVDDPKTHEKKAISLIILQYYNGRFEMVRIEPYLMK
jgi:hypothetical protein